MPAGRKPLATADKKLRGNPGKAKLNDHEAEPTKLTKMPEPPDFLGEHGVKCWNINGPLLIELGLLTNADLELFGTFCQAIHIMIMSSQDINANGMTIIGARGKTRNPALATFASASATIRSLSSEFGMTPSSRSRIQVPDPDGPSLGDAPDTTADDIS